MSTVTEKKIIKNKCLKNPLRVFEDTEFRDSGGWKGKEEMILLLVKWGNHVSFFLCKYVYSPLDNDE